MHSVINNVKKEITWPRYIWDMEKQENILISDIREYQDRFRDHGVMTKMKYGIEVLTCYNMHHESPTGGFQTSVSGRMYFQWHLFNKREFTDTYNQALLLHEKFVEMVFDNYPPSELTDEEKAYIEKSIEADKFSISDMLSRHEAGMDANLRMIPTCEWMIETKKEILANWETESQTILDYKFE
jgi:hypothetical protein